MIPLLKVTSLLETVVLPRSLDLIVCTTLDELPSASVATRVKLFSPKLTGNSVLNV